MLFRFVAAGFLVAGSAATAFAQAPGDYYGPSSQPATYSQPDPALAPPSMVPVQAAAPAAAPIPVMANRWAIGIAGGHMALAPKDTPDAKTEFGVGELSLRFRATPHLEIEGAFGGGREHNQDGSDGGLDVRTGMLALRYRFSPYQHWNWWLMGGLGGIQVAPHGAPDQVFQDSERPMGQLGVGLEHRWQQFAVHAELRAVHVGQRDNQDTPTAAPSKMTTTQPVPMPDQDIGGGQLTIGASYYF